MTTQRKTIDKEQYFTEAARAKELSSWIMQQPWFAEIREIVEPSAGDGVWLDVLPVTRAFDIEPRDPRIVMADFLTTPLPPCPKRLFVGNPPFGRIGKLALRFIKKAAAEGDYIAFILPASFGKESIANRVPKNMHCIYQRDLLHENFRFANECKRIPVVFQVWEKRQWNRVIMRKKLQTLDFQPTAKGGSAAVDFAICTHGSGYGKIWTANFATLNSNTHRFFTAKAPVAEIIKRLSSIDWQRFAKYTVGPPCISVKEIIEAYEDNGDADANEQA